MEKQDTTELLNNNDTSIQRKGLWLVDRQQAIDYQRAAQMTWWSILQGLAVAALAEKTYAVFSSMVMDKDGFILLYILTSALVIVSAWFQMSWAIILQRWPVHVTHTAFTLLLGITIYLMALYVDQPANWFLALLAVIISSIIIYIYNLKTEAILNLPRFITVRTIAIYLFFGAICVAAFFHIKYSPTVGTQTGWGVLIFFLAMTDWILQSRNMKDQNRQMDIPL